MDFHAEPGQFLILDCPSRGLALDHLEICRRGDLYDPAGHDDGETLGG